MLKSVVDRLCHITSLEIEGWKRLVPVREIFSKLGLDIDIHSLSVEEVDHPNSHTVAELQREVYKAELKIASGYFRSLK